MRRLALCVLGAFFALNPAYAEPDWLPVKEINLELQPGSPLDFSKILPNFPITDQARLIINGQGQLSRQDAPEKPLRFLCAAVAWAPPAAGEVDHAFIDRYVQQLRMHGYNMARFHFVDAAVMQGRANDFDFDPMALDRVRYFMAALKKNGIYWIIDGLTSERGAFGGVADDRWGTGGNLKLEVYVDDTAFDHWLRIQKELFGTVNPYTGLTTFADPALALVIPVNESGIEFNSFVHATPGLASPFSQKLEPAFNAFLQARYGSSEKLQNSWGGLGRSEHLEAGTVKLPVSRHGGGKRLLDFQEFVVGLEQRLALRMTNALRDLGYHGPVSMFNNWFTVQTALSRAPQSLTAANTYHDWIGTYHPGTTISDKSSLADGAAYLGEIALGRWLGQPLIVTEYDQLFWNRYRYETALAVPAYAGLQDWSALCRHGHGPIILGYDDVPANRNRILPYVFALDPIGRASETLVALLFRRGDITRSDFTVPLIVNGPQDLGDSLETREPERFKLLALLGAVGLKTADGATTHQFNEAAPITYRNVGLDDVVAGLKGDGFLAKHNRTDVSAGIFESGTGEILLDQPQRRLQIITKQTEALAFSSLKDKVQLGFLTVGEASERGLFALSALDDAPLDQSQRMLAVFASDARNSEMRFRDKLETIIEDWGTQPVQLLRSSLWFSLAQTQNAPKHWRISPVGLDGHVYPPVLSGEGALATRLENVFGKNSQPTTYFLVERY